MKSDHAGRVNCNHCGEARNDPLFCAKGYELVRCGGCGLAYIANPPTMAELERLYSAAAAYHLTLCDPASAAFAQQDRIARRHLDVVQRSAGKGRLLDVGCSTGQFLHRASAAGFAASGLELNESSVDFARSHYGENVVRGTIHDAPQMAGSVDVLTMFDVIEHVPDPSDDLRRAFALVAPGGLAVLSTPNIDGLFPRLSLPLANRLGYWPHPEPPYHLYQFSTGTLVAMMEKVGFVTTEVRHYAIDISYTFGQLGTLIRSPKRLLYACLFAPLAAAGPWIGQGDWIYVTARKPL